MTPRAKINWQISMLRGWTIKDAGFGCNSLIDPHGNIVVTSRHDAVIEALMIEWHTPNNWPTLFAELPRGTILVRPQGEDSPSFACCGCNIAGLLRFCQAADEAGIAVCGAWISFRLGKELGDELLKDLAALQNVADVSHTIH